MTKVVAVLCFLGFVAMIIVKAVTPAVSLFEMFIPLIVLAVFIIVKEVLRYFAHQSEMKRRKRVKG